LQGTCDDSFNGSVREIQIDVNALGNLVNEGMLSV